MIIKELIEKLNKCNPAAEVIIECRNDCRPTAVFDLKNPCKPNRVVIADDMAYYDEDEDEIGYRYQEVI